MVELGFEPLKDSVDNPKPQESSAPSFSLAGTSGDNFVLVMVGLPARGKTFTARRLRQYLKFFHGALCEVFNVGNYRRATVGASSRSSFFDPANPTNVAIRHRCAKQALNDMKAWLLEDARSGVGRVGILDATNSTKARREWLTRELHGMLQSKRHLIFIECEATDPSLVDSHLRQTRAKMPDYAGMTTAETMKDYMERIKHYEKVYETLGDEEGSWVRVTNAGTKVETNQISGFLPGRIIQFLMNLHMSPRSIYLSRHGQSEYNALGKIGGDSALSEAGEKYALELAKFVHTKILGINEDGSLPSELTAKTEDSADADLQSKENASDGIDAKGKDIHEVVAGKANVRARLFTSSLKRTIDTARHIKHPILDDGWVVMRPKRWRAIDEIYAGVFDGMTYEEIKAQAPSEFRDREVDKLHYRYPRGESYVDVIQRLDAIVHELHRHTSPVLIVGHQGILRIIYSYLMGWDREKAPFVPIPLNTVIQLTPHAYGCHEDRTVLIGPQKDAPSH